MRWCLIAVLWPALAMAHDWTPLDGPAIAALLGGQGVFIDGAEQRFAPDGTTELRAGNTVRRGRWAVRGARYCTLIPPLPDWQCYRVEAIHGELVRFVGRNGVTIEGAVIP